jgi:hypothetical protein
MAGDWIKMRGNLWDDPRVTRLCDLTDQSEAPIVGGLYWLWATADQHTEDGVMPGLTLRQIDRKTGIQGFGQALCDIGWLANHPEGVRIVNFEEHNGASAKKRCQTAKRVANFKAGNAQVTPPALPDEPESVSAALAREREEIEKRREEERARLDSPAPPDPATPGLICKAMKAEGVADVNPSHQTLRTLLDAGATEGEFVEAARKAVAEQKGFAYAIGIVTSERKRAATLAQQIHHGELPAAATRPTFAQQAADVARSTVPAKPGRDPALMQIEADAARAKPMTAEIRQALAQAAGRLAA